MGGFRYSVFWKETARNNKQGIQSMNFRRKQNSRLFYFQRILPLFILAAVMMAIPPGHAGENPFRLKAEIDTETAKPGETRQITVTIDIAADHYLYADRTDVIPADTPGLAFGKVEKPAGVEKQDPYAGKVAAYVKNVAIRLPVRVNDDAKSGRANIALTVAYQGCTQSMCFMPEEKKVGVSFEIAGAGEAPSGPETSKPDGFILESKPAESDFKLAKDDIREPPAQNDFPAPSPRPEENRFQKTAKKFGFAGVILLAFGLGFLTSLTPCVYPIIPITISVIGAGSSGNTFRGFLLSVFYVLGMSLVYSVFGVVTAWSGGLFGEQINHPAVRIVVACVFVILALGMFDLIFIQTPTSISSKLSAYTGKGFFGVFITGAASGAVVGPCVGPMIIALLVYIAALGSKLQGFLIMWSFALGMGMLFLLIGTFSGAAASLPKAGGWMEKIKRLFGVIMLALALYYVEPLLGEKISLLVLGIFLTGLGVFSGAFDRMTSESGGRDRFWKTVGVVFLVLGIAYVARFALDLKPSAERIPEEKKGIAWMADESGGLARARAESMPAMIDFTADWCVACKKLERETFTHPDVVAESNRFIRIQIDATDTKSPPVKKLIEKYGIIGFPTIVFIDSAGNRVPEKRIVDFVAGEEMLERMREVR